MWIRSRFVLPVARPAIENGAVHIEQRRITSVVKWPDAEISPSENVVDLGDSVLLPGLINAHCHLDYTDLAGRIARPKHFPDWIKALLAEKAQWSYSDYAQSWIHGAQMLLNSGVTTVADIEAVPELLPDVWTSTPVRVFSFLEMTGVKSRRPPADILRETAASIDLLSGSATRERPIGLSPHAPYSTSPELLRLCGMLAQQRRWRVVIHVAESDAELQMFLHGRGPLFDWLKSQRNMTDCGGVSPVQHLDRCGLLSDHCIAVHANYLQPGDVQLLAGRGAHVVHCPRSHHYFQHQSFPLLQLAAAGVNICLGTDSLVSVIVSRRHKPVLDLFAEMRALAESAPELPHHQILEMATRNGARALGFSGLLGELVPGAFADLISVPLHSADPYTSVIQHSGPVPSVMIDAQWIRLQS